MRLTFPLLATAVSLVTPALAQDSKTIPEIPGMKLVWNDEFDKDGLPDPNKWSYEMGFVRNKEPQLYGRNNARVEDGFLVIEAHKQRVPNPDFKEGSTDWKTNRKFADYTSTSLTTKERYGWLYGRFEVRARIDTRASSWPAFWTVGKDRPWPNKGEVDIMEYYAGALHANLIWAGGKNGAVSVKSQLDKIDSFNDPEWGNKFHVWAMDWDKDKIELSLDGVVRLSVPVDQVANKDKEGINPYRLPQFIILNQAIGHGDPEKITFPQKLEVDYVRVYQKTEPAK